MQHDDQRLRKRVLAAVPLALVPLEAARAAGVSGGVVAGGGAVAAVKAGAIGLAGVVLLLFAGWTFDWPRLILEMGGQKPPTTQTEAATGNAVAAPQPLPAAPPRNPFAGGSREGTHIYVAYSSPDGVSPSPAQPAAGARITIVPWHLDENQLVDMVRKAGLSPGATGHIETYLGYAPSGDSTVARQALEDLAHIREKLGQESIVASVTQPAPESNWIQGTAGPDGLLSSVLPSGKYEIYACAPDDPRPAIAADTKLSTYIEQTQGQRIYLTVSDVSQAELVMGRVVEQGTRRPLEGIRVDLWGEAVAGDGHLIATTNEFGYFSFSRGELPELGYGDYRLGPGDAFGQYYSGETREFLPVAIHEGLIEPGVKTDPIEIEMIRAGSVSGYVRTAAGFPAPGIRIFRRQPGDSSSRSVASTDEHGYYTFLHDGGIIEIYASGVNAPSAAVRLELAPDGSAKQDFTLEPTGHLLLQLLTPEGEAVEKADITLRQENHSHTVSRDATDGWFALRHVSVGNYTLRALVEGYATLTVDDVTIGYESETVRLVKRLQPSNHAVAVTVLDGNEHPVAGTQVSLMIWFRDESGSGSGHGLESQKTDAQGQTVFTNLGPGDYSVNVYALGIDEEFTVPETKDLVLHGTTRQDTPQWIPFSLTVLAPEPPHRPLDANFAQTWVVNEFGLHESRELVLGDNLIIFAKPGYPPALVPYTLDPMNTEPVRIEHQLQPGGAVSGVLLDETGEPIANAKLYAAPGIALERAREEDLTRSPASEVGFALAQGVRTGAAGEFTIEHLTAGAWYLSTSESPLEGPFTVAAGATTHGIVLQPEPPEPSQHAAGAGAGVEGE